MVLGAVLLAIPVVLNAEDGEHSKRHEGEYDTSKHYYVDKSGYWDESDHHQSYIINEGHHGYWDTRGEKRVFIIVRD